MPDMPELDQKNVGRGERWVLAQIILLILILFAPLISRAVSGFGQLAGIALGGLGLLMVLLSASSLRASFTIFPRPKMYGALSRSGLYAIVRHPMYGGVLLCALGWSLFHGSVLALFLTLGLGVFFDRKAAREEMWLAQKYPDYAQYQKQVRKLIPWLY